MAEEGCAEIQDGDLSPSATPLVLIHDGSGSIFNYYLLSPLDRPLLGIANPHFDTSAPWPGGIPEMARQYTSHLISAFPAHKSILLGGWSLGGMLALEVAHILATEPEYATTGIKIKGLVLIDSPYPLAPVMDGVDVVEPDIPFASTRREEVRVKVKACMEDARRAVGEWKLPSWEGEDEPPKAVLLRARERVVGEKGKVVRVDAARDDQLLGWGKYREQVVVESIDIPGSHYEIFKMDYIEGLTDAIKLACSKLDF